MLDAPYRMLLCITIRCQLIPIRAASNTETPASRQNQAQISGRVEYAPVSGCVLGTGKARSMLVSCDNGPVAGIRHCPL